MGNVRKQKNCLNHWCRFSSYKFVIYKGKYFKCYFPDDRGEIRELLAVNATDDDLTETNNVVTYQLLRPTKGFMVNSITGTVTVNRTALVKPLPKEIELIVVAKDSGVPSLTSTCSVIVRLSHLKNAAPGREFKISINENTRRGNTLTKLSDLGLLDGGIIAEDEIGVFEVSRGRLILAKKLDRETKDR